jgi:integrase
LLKTEWQDINFEQRFMRIRKSIVKTKTARQIPLSKKAIQILKEHEATKREDNDRIFWQWADSGALGYGFRIVVKNAGLDKRLTFHDLRHEATSRLFDNTDLSMMEIATITGHRDTRTLQRYTHLRAELMASKMDGKIEIGAEEFKQYMAWKESQNSI